MKKKISCLFIGALVALTLIMPCVADEATTDVVTEITTEIVTEMLDEEVNEPTETPVETDTAPVEDETALGGVNTPTEGENTPTGENPASAEDVSADEAWEAIKSKITDSATWTMIGSALVTILTVVATVKKMFDKISALVHSKADDESVKSALKDMEKDLKETFKDNYKEVSATMKRYEGALKSYEANEQRLYAILTLFMTNCKISESAKAEILNILADVKKYDGDISEVVAQAQEAIDEAVKDAEGKAPPTPTLDRMLEEDYMELG